MLEVLAQQDAPMVLAEIQDATAEAVPLNAYDLSKTPTGSIRAWVNLGWNASGFQHAGWVHISDPGLSLRITHQGRAALAEYPTADALIAASEPLYRQWDSARKAQLPDLPVDPGNQVVHAGSVVAHALRATEAFLAAWRSSVQCSTTMPIHGRRRPPRSFATTSIRLRSP